MNQFFDSCSSLANACLEKLDKTTQVFTHDVLTQRLARSEHPPRHTNNSRKLFLATEKNRARPFVNVNYQPRAIYPPPECHLESTNRTEEKVRRFLNRRKSQIKKFIIN